MASQTAAATGGQFSDVTISVLTFTGPQITEPLQRRAPEFTRLTGANVHITRVPINELYQTALRACKIQRQRQTPEGATRYDILVFPSQWLVDFVEAGCFEDLTKRVTATPALAWDDIAPFFREISATYNRRVYTIPLDGDFQMVYYRSDLLEKAKRHPPRTWDQYLAIAQALHGKDFDSDGRPDYGSCISKKPNAQAYSMMWSFASAFLQSQGTNQGAFFDPDSMHPLVRNPGFARALEIFKATGSFGPPNERELDVTDVRALLTAGRCALSLDWGDPGTLAIAPGSKVADTLGAVILPGSIEVLDRVTNALVPCDKITCPYAVNGVNHAPFAALGGWSGAINASSTARSKDTAFAFLTYLSQPAQANQDVTIGASGLNPYRRSQFSERQVWLDAGMSEQAVARYLGAIGVSLSNPNMVLDLRIPHNHHYQQVVLDSALARYLADELDIEQTMHQIERGWNAITVELGRDAQRKAYRASLGLSN